MSVMKGSPLFSLWCMYVCPERAPYVFILVSVYPPERGLLDIFTLVSACLSDFWADIYMHYACSHESRQTLRLNIFVTKMVAFGPKDPHFKKLGLKWSESKIFEMFFWISL